MWPTDAVECLRVSAGVMGAAIERMNYKRRSDLLLAEHRQLIDSLEEVVFRINTQGRWTLLSPAWQTRLGWKPAHCLGRAAMIFVHPDDRMKALQSWNDVVAGRAGSHRGELRFGRPGGSYCWMLVSARGQRDENSRLTGVIGTLTDISAAKQTEAELIAARGMAEQASRSKTEFLSTMSHELRTPLNGVIGLAESLLETGGPFDPERTQRYLDLIRVSGRQLLAQINDILDLARIEAGRMELNPTQFDLAQLCGCAVDSAQDDIRAKRLRTEVRGPPEPVIVTADGRLLLQVLQNLVSNAVKFTPEGGCITVVIEVRRDGGVALAVSDTGIGIAADKLHLLFKPFSQVDGSLARRFGGTGLGLSLVERLVQLHGGNVTVRSVLNEGSTFTVELPATVHPMGGIASLVDSRVRRAPLP